LGVDALDIITVKTPKYTFAGQIPNGKYAVKFEYRETDQVMDLVIPSTRHKYDFILLLNTL
jgi:hypothetical protein